MRIWLNELTLAILNTEEKKSKVITKIEIFEFWLISDVWLIQHNLCHNSKNTHWNLKSHIPIDTNFNCASFGI